MLTSQLGVFFPFNIVSSNNITYFGYFYHVKCVQASKCCSDLLHCLGLLRKEFLKNSRLGKNLLDLLCSSQVSSNIRTFHSQRALHQQTSSPVLQGKISWHWPFFNVQFKIFHIKDTCIPLPHHQRLKVQEKGQTHDKCMTNIPAHSGSSAACTRSWSTPLQPPGHPSNEMHTVNAKKSYDISSNCLCTCLHKELPVWIQRPSLGNITETLPFRGNVSTTYCKHKSNLRVSSHI